MDRWQGAWDIFVMQLTWYAPTLIVLGAGIFLALWRWRCHRRVSTLAIVGVMLFLSGIVYSLWISWPINSDDGWDGGLDDYLAHLRLIHALVHTLQALGLACLVAAIFVNRRVAAASRKAAE
jgi:hypothetical protein